MAMTREELLGIAEQITSEAVKIQEADCDTARTDRFIADEIKRHAFYRSDRETLERMIHHQLTGEMPDW